MKKLHIKCIGLGLVYTIIHTLIRQKFNYWFGITSKLELPCINVMLAVLRCKHFVLQPKGY